MYSFYYILIIIMKLNFIKSYFFFYLLFNLLVMLNSILILILIYYVLSNLDSYNYTQDVIDYKLNSYKNNIIHNTYNMMDLFSKNSNLYCPSCFVKNDSLNTSFTLNYLNKISNRNITIISNEKFIIYKQSYKIQELENCIKDALFMLQELKNNIN